MIDEKKGTVGAFNFMQMDFNICPYLRRTTRWLHPLDLCHL